MDTKQIESTKGGGPSDVESLGKSKSDSVHVRNFINAKEDETEAKEDVRTKKKGEVRLEDKRIEEEEKRTVLEETASLSRLVEKLNITGTVNNVQEKNDTELEEKIQEEEIIYKKILFWNVAGLNKKMEDKEKKNAFLNYIKEFDIVGLSETWIRDYKWIEIKKKLLEGYQWEHQHATKEDHVAKGRAKGGILIGIKKEWELKRGNLIPTVELIGNGVIESKLQIGNDKWTIWTIYRDKKEKDSMTKVIEYLRERIKPKYEDFFIMGGDMNVRIGEEGSMGIKMAERYAIVQEKRKSKDKTKDAEGKALLSLCKERGWYILNGNVVGDEEGEYTYSQHRKIPSSSETGSSVNDYVIVNIKVLGRIRRFQVGNRPESDHRPLEVEVNMEEEYSEDSEE
ncbi:uncharacterized protein LOC117218718 [Megalopta genalis]|uniref:uncharacterized protein LOC117218718 n=1 Tax=Megalopta genalis TaxID=115081 RepID=UPI003FD19E8A